MSSANPALASISTPGPRRRRLAAGLVALGAFAILTRLLLLHFGRFTVIDAYYVDNAALIARGLSPYEDFVHVAFPMVEWVYALVFRAFGQGLTAASLTTGGAVVGTALLVHRILLPRVGRAAAVAAAVLYLTAAPVIAWHQFQRELWTNFFLAASFAALLPVAAAPSDRRSLLGGLLLAAALFAKLTAAVGAAALLLEMLLRRQVRHAALALVAAACLFVAGTLLCTAAWSEEFLTQVFVFYFFKGESGAFAGRAQVFLANIDPNLALGACGLALAAARRKRSLRPAGLLLAAWLAHYTVISPSYWDHNAIDLTLPAACGAGYLVSRVLHRRGRRLAVALVLAGVVAGVRGFGPALPPSFPHGLRSDVPRWFIDQTRGIRAASRTGDYIVAPNPMAAFLSERLPFQADYELEPVYRGVIKELRRDGFRAAFARRRTAIAFGTRQEYVVPSTFDPMAVRIHANVMAHTVPRVLDAIHRRELAVVIPVLLSQLEGELVRSGYAPSAELSGAWLRRTD